MIDTPRGAPGSAQLRRLRAARHGADRPRSEGRLRPAGALRRDLADAARGFHRAPRPGHARPAHRSGGDAGQQAGPVRAGPARAHPGHPPARALACRHPRNPGALLDLVRGIRAGARFTVPAHLRALMAAAPLGRETAGEGEMVDLFEMPQKVPPYLLAFAVGDLSPRQLSQRSAVWAERSVADAAAWELDGVETMLQVAEDLFGPYEWERYDVLVMPPSFPRR